MSNSDNTQPSAGVALYVPTIWNLPYVFDVVYENGQGSFEYLVPSLNIVAPLSFIVKYPVGFPPSVWSVTLPPPATNVDEYPGIDTPAAEHMILGYLIKSSYLM